MTPALRDAVFAIGPHIRYVAFGEGQRVETAQRDGIEDAGGAVVSQPPRHLVTLGIADADVRQRAQYPPVAVARAGDVFSSASPAKRSRVCALRRR